VVRFQADADLNHVIVAALLRRAPSVGFRTASAAGLENKDDLEVLAIAAASRRILVTHDARTMPQFFAKFIETARSSGVLIVPQHLPVAATVDDLQLISAATTEEEWVNRICYLPL
jgi:hypothetical protein